MITLLLSFNIGVIKKIEVITIPMIVEKRFKYVW